MVMGYGIMSVFSEIFAFQQTRKKIHKKRGKRIRPLLTGTPIVS